MRLLAKARIVAGGRRPLCARSRRAGPAGKTGSVIVSRIVQSIGTIGAIAVAAIALTVGAAPVAVRAQTYPSRPIHLIVNFAPGGAGDILGRIIGNQLSAELKQSVVVENHSGAGGTIGARDTVNAAPDGYTLAVGQTPEIAINPYFMKNVGYDTLKDLQPIALAGVMPLALVVPPQSPYATAAQWVAALRANAPMNFASAGIGTPGHLAGELLKLKLDPKLVHVPYKGAGPALNDVAGGQVDFYFPAAASGMPLVQGGRVKLLAVSSAKRASVVPDIPTVAEATGISNFDFTLWVGFFAPRAVPKDIVTRLHDAINKIILEADIKKKLESTGSNVEAMSIEQFDAFVRADIGRYRAIIEQANLKPE
jgi:tripartite-type tricarboxylate transporter receptor subunit TctC